jgi:hypothetical protein
VAVPRAESEQLVRQGGDNRDQRYPTDDADDQALAGQQAEHQDAQDDEDDQELGATALVRGGVLTYVIQVERILVL